MKSDPHACDSCLAPPDRPDPPSGLARVPFRTGTHDTLLKAMIEALAGAEVPGDGAEGPAIRPLARLGTRSTSDPALALVDLWASALHVLSFYQEAALNEAFLGTAEERWSLVELAQMIGHQPDPGVSAETWLAFEMNDLAGRPFATPLESRTPVQGLPPSGNAPPPVFETLDDATLRPQWSTLRPLHTRPAYLAIVGPDSNGVGVLYWIDWSPGPNPQSDAIASEFVHPINVSPPDASGPVFGRPVRRLALAGALTPVKPGDFLLFRSITSQGAFAMLKVVEIEPQPLNNQVVITLDHGFDPVDGDAGPGAATALPQLPIEVEDLIGLPQSALAERLRAHTLTEDEGRRLVDAYRPGARALSELLASIDPYARDGGGQGIFLSPAMFRPFGHDAQDSASLNRALGVTDQYTWDTTPPSIWQNAQGTVRGGTPGSGTGRIALDRASVRSAVGSSVVIEGAGQTQLFSITRQFDTGLRDFFRTVATTLLDLTKVAGAPAAAHDFPFRESTIRVFTEAAIAAPRVVDTPVEGRAITLERFHPDLRSGQVVLVQGTPLEAAGESRLDPELRTIVVVEHVGGRTHITLDRPLTHRYRRDSVLINANVVRAIHGETTRQVLGDGDARQAHQRFLLRRPPLSHRASSTRVLPEIEVQVDGVAWKRVNTLFGSRSDERVYVLRQRSDDAWEVRFGDGQQGARLPTGQGNVVATWRTGLGTSGNAASNTVSTLRSQPFGVRTVTNPFPATGGVDPERPDELRRTIPRRTRTLGRVVSLTDIEDFAGNTPGVRKAHAVSLSWRGGPLALVTVAGDGVDASILTGRLQRALMAVAPQGLRLIVREYAAAFFLVELRIDADPAFERSVVHVRVTERLRRAFSFDRRAFGQPVTRSEVLQEASSVAGVRGVLVDRFERSDRPLSLPAGDLHARQAGIASGELHAAELLLLEPGTPGLTIAVAGGSA
ncbi:MAG: baseplate J/gp47 family protein [Myxococcota bacterium]